MSTIGSLSHMGQIKSEIHHFHLMNYRARAVVVLSQDVVREAQRRHQLDPLTTIALGRALSCTALLASTLKKAEDYYHCSFSGNGLIKKINAECNGVGDCRGFAVPSTLRFETLNEEDIPSSVGEAIGHGRLTVVRGKTGQPTSSYTAVIDLYDGEIASDFAKFLTESEQIPSAVAAGVKLDSSGEVVAAGAVLFQRLGGAEISQVELEGLEERIKNIQLTDRLTKNQGPEELIKYIQNSNENFGLLLSREMRFRCHCDRKKMALTAMTLGQDDLQQLIKEYGKIEVCCHYCSATHQFELDELSAQ